MRHATRARTSLNDQPAASEGGASRAASLAREDNSEISEEVESKDDDNVKAQKVPRPASSDDDDDDPFASNYGEGDQSMAPSKTQPAALCNTNPPNISNEPNDTISIRAQTLVHSRKLHSKDGDDDAAYRGVPEGLRKMSIRGTEADDPDTSPVGGGWIQTPTTQAYDRQISPEKAAAVTTSEPEKRETTAEKQETKAAKFVQKPDLNIWQSKE